jgi:hypothetical protein
METVYTLGEGEFQYGMYTVQLVDWINERWTSCGPWMRAVVTNHRLMIFPEMGRYPEDYDVLLPNQIFKSWNVSLQGRDGIMIRLQDNRCLHMLVDWGQGSKLVHDLYQMMYSPVSPRIHPRQWIGQDDRPDGDTPTPQVPPGEAIPIPVPVQPTTKPH